MCNSLWRMGMVSISVSNFSSDGWLVSNLTSPSLPRSTRLKSLFGTEYWRLKCWWSLEPAIKSIWTMCLSSNSHLYCSICFNKEIRSGVDSAAEKLRTTLRFQKYSASGSACNEPSVQNAVVAMNKKASWVWRDLLKSYSFLIEHYWTILHRWLHCSLFLRNATKETRKL